MIRVLREGNVSDIAIRLDGLLLGMVMAAGAILFALIAAISAVRSVLAAPGTNRSWHVARLSIGLASGHAAGLAILVVLLDEYGTPIEGPNWIDWLAVPWLGLILLGLVLLARSRARRAMPATGD